MPRAKVNNIEIEYETFGSPSSKPLLLVNGLGSQMIRWEKEFCQLFVERGFYLVIFDNRDVGLSTKIEEWGEPNLMEAYIARRNDQEIKAPYSLEDMADDAIGLLDHLKIEKAHIAGVSMGGMIVQVIAYRHPNRVLSLTSIMSTTGNPELPPGKQEAMEVLMATAPKDKIANIEHTLKLRRILYGTGFPFNDDRERKKAEVQYDRCYYPVGKNRQVLAVMVTGNRKDKLASIKVPTLIIHGSEDPIFPIEHAKDTSEAIQGSELLIINGMGHSTPPETWDQITNAIVLNATKA